MKANQAQIVSMIGQKKFDEEIEILGKLVEQGGKKGDFQAIEGDIDGRPESLKQPALMPGFAT